MMAAARARGGTWRPRLALGPEEEEGEGGEQVILDASWPLSVGRPIVTRRRLDGIRIEIRLRVWISDRLSRAAHARDRHPLIGSSRRGPGSGGGSISGHVSPLPNIEPLARLEPLLEPLEGLDLLEPKIRRQTHEWGRLAGRPSGISARPAPIYHSRRDHFIWVIIVRRPLPVCAAGGGSIGPSAVIECVLLLLRLVLGLFLFSGRRALTSRPIVCRRPMRAPPAPPARRCARSSAGIGSWPHWLPPSRR